MRIFYLSLLSLLCTLGRSQQSTIVSGEYFFDTQRPYGQGVPIPLSTPETDLSTTFQIPTTALDDGIHQLFVRFRQRDGRWSQTQVFPVWIKHARSKSIVRGEYFFDEQRRPGEGNVLTLQQNADLATVSQRLDVADLEDGIHRLFVRFLDSDGTWSATLIFPVWIKHEQMLIITTGEYFFDELVPYGSGFTIPVTAGTGANSSIQDVIPAPVSLTPGSHRLYYRFQDNSGRWSQTYSELVCLNVTDSRYQLDASAYCFGEAIGFLHDGSNTGNSSYIWDLDNDGNFDDNNSVGENFTYVPLTFTADTTLFRYQLTSGLCPQWSKVDTLTARISPEISVIIDNIINETNEMQNGAVQISIGGGVSPYRFEWISNGTLVSSVEDPQGLSAGQYQVIVTDSNNCMATAEVVIDQIVGTAEVLMNEEISVFPNPATTELSVMLKPASVSRPIQLHDLHGRLVFSDQVLSGQSEYLLVCANFSSGIYRLSVWEEGRYAQRLVVIQ